MFTSGRCYWCVLTGFVVHLLRCRDGQLVHVLVDASARLLPQQVTAAAAQPRHARAQQARAAAVPRAYGRR